jgi:hypothetical protein
MRQAEEQEQQALMPPKPYSLYSFFMVPEWERLFYLLLVYYFYDPAINIFQEKVGRNPQGRLRGLTYKLWRPREGATMKILGVTLVILIVFAVGFWGLFYYSVRVARETISPLQATSTANSSGARHLPKINPPTSTAPANFHGPTSAPHIIGPSGPPPNY